MEINEFWMIIEDSLSPDQEEQLEKLADILSTKTDQDLIGFAKQYAQLLIEAYTWDLWAACFVVNNGSASDDEFEDFRDWLISQGQELYESAIQNPESVIDQAEPEHMNFEVLRYVVSEVYDERHGTEFAEEVSIVALPGIDGMPSEPVGQNWTEEQAWKRFPLLTEWVNSN